MTKLEIATFLAEYSPAVRFGTVSKAQMVKNFMRESKVELMGQLDRATDPIQSARVEAAIKSVL